MVKTPVKLKLRVLFSPNASKELISLRPVFKQLSKVHEGYINAEPSTETSFWHPERSQTGLLASAVWRIRGKTALEECGCDRRKRSDRPKHRGRRDLYIGISETAAFECEAKRLSVNLAKNVETSAKRIYEALHTAAKEAKSKGDTKDRLGLCFVAPRISKSRHDGIELDRQLFKRLEPTKSHFQCDALVWIHRSGPLPENKTSWLYPSLLLAVKQEKGNLAR